MSIKDKPLEMSTPKLESKGSKKFDQFISMKEPVASKRLSDMPHPPKSKNKKNKNKSKNGWNKQKKGNNSPHIIMNGQIFPMAGNMFMSAPISRSVSATEQYVGHPDQG